MTTIKNRTIDIITKADWIALRRVNIAEVMVEDTRSVREHSVTFRCDICAEKLYLDIVFSRPSAFCFQSEQLTKLGFDGLAELQVQLDSPDNSSRTISIEHATIASIFEAKDRLLVRLEKFAETVERLDQEAFEASLAR